MFLVVMAGGSGTRFWPASRKAKPKQLLSLFGDQTMLAQTINRFAGIVPNENVLVVSSKQLKVAVQEAIPNVPAENILLEPVGRNTAPCIGWAAITARDRVGHGNDVLAVFPSDHYIRDVEAFRAAASTAAELARDGAIVTLGIEPTRPETGFGYIRRGQPVGAGFHVDAFVEKPKLEVALSYLEDGRFLWNSGMFFFRVDTILAEIERQLPSMSTQLEELAEACRAGDTERADAIFSGMQSISIDFGVMENAKNVVVVPARFGWSDVGHWDALPEVREADENGNVISGNVVPVDCRDCVFEGTTDRLMTAVGLDRMVVVDSGDAVLVIPRDRVQDVRMVVDSLRGDRAKFL